MNTSPSLIAIRSARIARAAAFLGNAFRSARSVWKQLPRLKRGDGLVIGVGGLL